MPPLLLILHSQRFLSNSGMYSESRSERKCAVAIEENVNRILTLIKGTTTTINSQQKPNPDKGSRRAQCFTRNSWLVGSCFCQSTQYSCLTCSCPGTFCSYSISQAPQEQQVKLTTRNKLMINNVLAMKKDDQHQFHIWWWLTRYFWFLVVEWYGSNNPLFRFHLETSA